MEPLYPLPMAGRRKKFEEEILLGNWTPDDLDVMLRSTANIPEASTRIEVISRRFLGLPYAASTLRGSSDTPEEFVVDLQEVDCFTYIDYVEAMRLSRSFDGFLKHLRRVRYRSGIIAFRNRRHFFTDWGTLPNVKDVTRELGQGRTRQATKFLNQDSRGLPLVKGITVTRRTIAFVPEAAADREVRERLRTGDYVGIFTEKEGLDVSHVGIAVRTGETVLLRHASSIEQRVVDQDLNVYLKEKPGFVVLRPV